MGQVKGAKEYQMWEKGQNLTRKEAMLAFCYDCNGKHSLENAGVYKDDNDEIIYKFKPKVNCMGQKNCTMYQYFPYRSR